MAQAPATTSNYNYQTRPAYYQSRELRSDSTNSNVSVGSEEVFTLSSEGGKATSNLGTKTEANLLVPRVNPAMAKRFSVPVEESLKRRDAISEGVIRRHFITPILSDLDKVSPNSGEPSRIPHANKLFRNILRARDELLTDPYREILMTFFRAITIDDAWTQCSEEQFQGAKLILGEYLNEPHLTNQKIDRAIARLKRLGFSTGSFATGTLIDPELDGENVDFTDEEIEAFLSGSL